MADLAINAKTRLREDERCRSNPLGTALPWSSTVTWTVRLWKTIENIGKTVEFPTNHPGMENFLGDGNSLNWGNSIISLKTTKNSAMRTEIHKKNHRGKCLNLYHWQCAFQRKQLFAARKSSENSLLSLWRTFRSAEVFNKPSCEGLGIHRGFYVPKRIQNL